MQLEGEEEASSNRQFSYIEVISTRYLQRRLHSRDKSGLNEDLLRLDDGMIRRLPCNLDRKFQGLNSI